MKDEKTYKLVGIESMVFVDKYGSTLDIHPIPQLEESKIEEKPTEGQGEEDGSY